MELFKAAPDLARGIAPDRLAAATDSVRVKTLEIPVGPWSPSVSEGDGHLGLLVLDGTLLREVCIGPDWSAEVLGAGDLLRPWLEDASSFAVARWRAIEPVRIAILDGEAGAELAKHQTVVGELLERTLRRARALAVHAVIEGVHRIDQRLLLLFWHLAEQRGQLADGKIVVPFPLTHEHLARLVGARRPTVTTALGALERSGEVTRRRDGTWVVAGEPPRPDISVEETANAA